MILKSGFDEKVNVSVSAQFLNVPGGGGRFLNGAV
jgi:hypothetical protein